MRLSVGAKTVLVGGAAGGALYGYYSLRRQRARLSGGGGVPATGPQYLGVSPPDPVQVARSYRGPLSPLQLTLFQYQTCPFCCKVRAFLNYYGVSHQIVEVNPVLRRELKWSAYKKVPILMAAAAAAGGRGGGGGVGAYGGASYQLNDSSLIVSALMSLLVNDQVNLDNIPQLYPSMQLVDPEDGGVTGHIIANQYHVMHGDSARAPSDAELESERVWRMWADAQLVHVLSPNVYRTMGEALNTFRWFARAGNWDQLFASWEQLVVVYVGAAVMYVIGKRLRRRHNLKDDVRESLYECCNVWLSELQRRRTVFHGGANPNLADLAVYGLLSSIEGCQAFADLANNTDIMQWYSEMNVAVSQHRGAALIQKRAEN